MTRWQGDDDGDPVHAVGAADGEGGLRHADRDGELLVRPRHTVRDAAELPGAGKRMSVGGSGESWDVVDIAPVLGPSRENAACSIYPYFLGDPAYPGTGASRRGGEAVEECLRVIAGSRRAIASCSGTLANESRTRRPMLARAPRWRKNPRKPSANGRARGGDPARSCARAERARWGTIARAGWERRANHRRCPTSARSPCDDEC